MYHLVKKLNNKPKPPPSNLTTDTDGNLLKSPKEKAERWGSFFRGKFDATPAEAERPPLSPLSSERSVDDTLTREEFDQALRRPD